MSAINAAVEAVMDLINGMGLYSSITRGALGTGAGLVCEIAPSVPEAVFMDKNSFIPLDLTINGKHRNLQTLSDTVNQIYDTLTRRKEYPDGNGWEIVDITGGTIPQIIGRDDTNEWLMAFSLIVKLYRKDDESV